MGGASGDGFGSDFMQAAKVSAPAEPFSRPNYSATKYSDYQLVVSAGYYNYVYDFKARLVIIPTSGITSIPFAQMDRDALMEAHDELVRLGGKPPPLPDEKPAEQKPAGLKL